MDQKTNETKPRAFQKSRTAVQLVALAAFVLLIIQGNEQFLLVLFLILGIAASVIFGRLFCGWICPMGTLLRFQTYIFRKLRIKRKYGNSTVLKQIVRWFVLLLIIMTLIITRQRGIHIPLLPYMTAAAVLLTFFLDESFWHRSLCPFGTLLSVSAKPSRNKVAIDKENCIRCGKCEKVCPSQSISIDEQGKRQNFHSECLTCRACISVCPTGAIKYGTAKN